MDWKEVLEELFKDGDLSDYDVMDFEEEHGLTYGEASRHLDHLKTKGTPCEGCKEVGMRPNMPPCTSCSRQPGLRDMYVPREEKNHEKRS